VTLTNTTKPPVVSPSPPNVSINNG
jgi:hypothetical protein